jgi:hypothetical protein
VSQDGTKIGGGGWATLQNHHNGPGPKFKGLGYLLLNEKLLNSVLHLFLVSFDNSCIFYSI